MLPFILSWEKSTPRAHICTQRFAAHPPILEEAEGYKNNFVFLRIPDLNFQEVEEEKHNFVSHTRFLM
jgi:hypothetical protein